METCCIKDLQTSGTRACLGLENPELSLGDLTVKSFHISSPYCTVWQTPLIRSSQVPKNLPTGNLFKYFFNIPHHKTYLHRQFRNSYMESGGMLYLLLNGLNYHWKLLQRTNEIRPSSWNITGIYAKRMHNICTRLTFSA